MSEVENGRILPIPDVVPLWEHEWSEYPDEILVGMKNGHMIRYRLNVEQPHPAFEKAMNIVKKITGNGYEAPKKRRRRL